MVLTLVFTIPLFVAGIIMSLFYGLIFLLNKMGEIDS